MSFPAGRSEASEHAAHLTVLETGRRSADGERRGLSARVGESSDLDPFAVEVQRRDHVTLVRPRGELDLATVDTLRSALDAAIAESLHAELNGIEAHVRLALDLRGLSFIDSNGLHLLVALHRRAQRDGFQLTLLAPAAPIDRAIQLCGLDQVLPFVAPDALEGEPPDPRGALKPATDRGERALGPPVRYAGWSSVATRRGSSRAPAPSSIERECIAALRPPDARRLSLDPPFRSVGSVRGSN